MLIIYYRNITRSLIYIYDIFYINLLSTTLSAILNISHELSLQPAPKTLNWKDKQKQG